MLALPDTQARVMDALLSRGDPAAAAALVRPSALPTARRLAIYRNNRLQNLVGALGAVYPVIRRLVGDAFFGQAAKACIGIHPSRSGDLHDFGGAFPVFLRAYRPAAPLPYLPDVAALEWAVHRAYHEAELPALALARLTEVPAAAQPGLRLVLQPCARLVSSPYPVLRIWQSNQPGEDDASTISLDQGGVQLLVVQRSLEIEFVLLDAVEYGWLAALAEGMGLGQASARAFDLDPAFDLASTLARHIGRGLFTELQT